MGYTEVVVHQQVAVRILVQEVEDPHISVKWFTMQILKVVVQTVLLEGKVQFIGVVDMDKIQQEMGLLQ